MVDEFQDTNRLQLDADRRAAGPRDPAVRRRRRVPVHLPLPQRRPRGLPRRAGARPEDAGAPLEVLPLRGNFRSRPEVLAAVNSLGAALLRRLRAARRRPREAAGRRRRRPSSCSRTLRPTRPGSDRLEGRGDRPGAAGRGVASPPCVAEARFLAQRLRELADAGVAARRHGRAAARLHPRRRLRGGARARRPRALRRRRPRLLVPAAGRGHAAPARRGREPARRRAPLRRACLARLRR